MNVETAVQQQKPKAKPDEYAPHARLAIAYFKEPVTLGGELSSAVVWSGTGHRPGNTVDSITPAWLDDELRVLDKGDGPAHGIVLRRKHRDLNTGKKVVQQAFVPMGSVRCMLYGE